MGRLSQEERLLLDALIKENGVVDLEAVRSRHARVQKYEDI